MVYITKRPNLKLKTQPKQLASLLLTFALIGKVNSLQGAPLVGSKLARKNGFWKNNLDYLYATLAARGNYFTALKSLNLLRRSYDNF